MSGLFPGADRYEWIAFAVVLPVGMGLLAAVVLLYGAQVAGIVVVVLAVMGRGLRIRLAARLRMRASARAIDDTRRSHSPR